jgi:hypothetical protein
MSQWSVMPYSSSTRGVTTAWSKPPTEGASTSFQISTSRLPCGWVAYW